MADVQAFRGFRYDLARVGNLSDVIAPPYDVIDAALQQQLFGAVVGAVVLDDLRRPEREAGGQIASQRLGQIGHVVEAGGAAFEEPTADLPGAEARLAALGKPV